MIRRLSGLAMMLWVCVIPLTGLAQSYYFKHFETDDGLANNSVNTITQDHSGFIWIGTRGGLARFDGYTFKSFSNNNGSSDNLWNNFITSIIEDKHGKLWIGTGKGIFRYDPRTEEISPLTLSPQAYINGFVIDQRGNFWILGQNRLYFYDSTAKRLEDMNTQVSRIALKPDGDLLLGNYDGVLYTCDTRTKKIAERRVIDARIAPNMRAITKIYPITNELTFIGYKNGLIIYNVRTGQTREIPLLGNIENGVMVRDIYRSEGDEYWIGTEAGLYIYNLRTERWVKLTKKQGDPYAISDNSVYSVFKDKAGDMWVGTFFGGLNYHSRQNARFEKYYPVPLDNSLSGNAVSEIWKDKKGDLYIGTEDAGLNKLDIASGAITNYIPVQKKNGFYSNIHTLVGLDNRLFIGSFFHGMQIMDMRTGKITDEFRVINEPGENGSDFALTLCLTRDSDVIVGTTGDYGGLFRYIPQSKTFHRFKQLSLGTAIYHVIQDHEGKLWAGLRSQTAVYIDPKTGKSGKKIFGDPKKEYSVHYILEDSKYSLWFSTIGGGLVRLSPDRKSFKKLTTLDGLPSDVLYGMVEDDQGHLWIGSAKGLVCLDLSTEKIRVYTRANGLISDQFNYNSAGKGADGKLYFGTVKGLIAFNPRELHQQEPSPRTYFTGFQINNQEVIPGKTGSPLNRSVAFTDTIVLAPEQNSFSIEFAALNYSSPRSTRYRYMMSGMDRSWTYSNTSRKAYFTDLSPGRYTFTVKAASNVGTWVSGERRLFIEVLPHLWESTTAYLLYVLSGALIVLLVVRYYHRYQKKQNATKLKLFEHQKEREIYQAKIEFFTHIAHEIQTPLTLISVPVGRVLNKAEDYPGIRKSLLTVGKYTDQLIELTTKLLDFRQTEMEQFGLNFVKIDISHLLRDLVDSFAELAQEYQVTVQSDFPEECIAFVDREAFQKICSNLITNAIKYAVRSVSVKLAACNNDTFTISVGNDGKGIPEEYREKIFEPFFRLRTTEKPGTGIGLPLARSLTELHNGTLTLVSGEEDHIVFNLTLPRRQQFEFNLGNWKKIGEHER